MKKRTLWIVLLCLALMLSGCGAETNTDAVQPDVPDASSEAAQPDAAPADTAGTDDAEIEAPAETLPEAVSVVCHLAKPIPITPSAMHRHRTIAAAAQKLLLCCCFIVYFSFFQEC